MSPDVILVDNKIGDYFRMTYQRRREREKIAAAKIEAKYAVS